MKDTGTSLSSTPHVGATAASFVPNKQTHESRWGPLINAIRIHYTTLTPLHRHYTPTTHQSEHSDEWDQTTSTIQYNNQDKKFLFVFNGEIMRFCFRICLSLFQNG